MRCSLSVFASVAAVLAAMCGSAPAVQAVPPGYQQDTIPAAGGATAAISFAADGTLYVADMLDRSRINVIAPDGTRSTLPVSGVTISSNIGGLWGDPLGAGLLITDSKGYGDGLGELYLIDLTSGAGTVLLSGLDCIDDVAVRSTGEIFVSNAAGGGAGGVYQVGRTTSDPSTNATPVVSGLDYAAGLAFDLAGNLLFQQATATFTGEVYRLNITGGGGSLAVGSTDALAAGLSAAFDLAVDSEGDVFVTGSGGVFQLDRDGGGNFLGTASPFDGGGFATEIAFSVGTSPFAPHAGPDAGRLVYVPAFGSADLIAVTPTPEPATWALLAAGLAAVSLSSRRQQEGRS